MMSLKVEGYHTLYQEPRSTFGCPPRLFFASTSTFSSSTGLRFGQVRDYVFTKYGTTFSPEVRDYVFRKYKDYVFARSTGLRFYQVLKRLFTKYKKEPFKSRTPAP